MAKYPANHRRTRLSYLGLAFATISVGWTVHAHGSGLGPVLRDVLGDALWAAMMVGWMGALAPNVRPLQRALAAYAVCVVVELSQGYHAPWIDSVRRTSLGHLVLGSDFDPRDFLAYALGVAGAWVLDAGWIARRRAPRD